ncbi:MAG TPA: hypothetical protein VFD49_07405 [Candidatus Dormibacteraeota bacterium]|nr:hypothetical protein [Candidatus Dormibacteraeota bacterium]
MEARSAQKSRAEKLRENAGTALSVAASERFGKSGRAMMAA